MADAAQFASLRAIWEVSIVSGPYAGEIAQFGLSFGVARQDQRWDQSTPSYRGRSGLVRETWHDISATDYTGTVAWEADMDDNTGTLGVLTQADVFAKMHDYGTALLPYLSSLSKIHRLILAPHQQTGRQSHSLTSGAVGSSVVVYKTDAGKGTGVGMLPPEVAAAVSVYGIGNRRKSRGRLYFGPLTSTIVTNTGLLGPGFLDGIRASTVTFLDAMLGQESTDTGQPTGDRFIPWVHNPSPDPLVGTNLPTGSPIATVRTDDKPDSQRRRESRYRPTKTASPLGGW